ncbi:hypothetical protein ElyMa_004606000 [Elysia marginata]|uniref:Uncharacterized protein n=1 Tax=Elysia marginata TaxID=1093978 RepID=A0AAV4HW05_9GAST|nr:hypothetical protein ElyMa_004606000 [Elysia marginata]
MPRLFPVCESSFPVEENARDERCLLLFSPIIPTGTIIFSRLFMGSSGSVSLDDHLQQARQTDRVSGAVTISSPGPDLTPPTGVAPSPVCPWARDFTTGSNSYSKAPT